MDYDCLIPRKFKENLAERNAPITLNRCRSFDSRLHKMQEIRIDFKRAWIIKILLSYQMSFIKQSIENVSLTQKKKETHLTKIHFAFYYTKRSVTGMSSYTKCIRSVIIRKIT